MTSAATLRSLSIDVSDDKHFVLKSKKSYGFLSTIPERKPLQRFGTWMVAATDSSVCIIRENVPLENITWESEYAKVLFESILLRTRMSEQIREQTAAYKLTRVVPIQTEKLNKDPKASPYQVVAGYNGLLSEGYGYWMEQGTGKTFSAIITIDNLPDATPEKPAKILVVCPNNVRLNWSKELEKFSVHQTKATVIRGTQLARVSTLIRAISKDGQRNSVAIVGYDTIAGMWEALQMIEWDLVILDESHFIRNPRTKRWRYVEKLRHRSKKRLVLTGTPMANSINDLWTQFEFMGEGFSGFSTFNGFKNFYGVYDRSSDHKGYDRLVGLQNIPLMKDRISRYAFITTKKEALPDLPDKVYDIAEVEMGPEQQAAYDKLAGDLAIEIEGELASGDNPQLIVNNILTMLLKLAQITSGFLNIPPVRDQDGTIIKAGFPVLYAPNPKIELCMELLTEKGPDSKTLIWACFQHDIEKLSRACMVNNIKAVTFYGKTGYNDRLEAEQQFNEDPDCKVFIGNPGAGGTGLNLLGYPIGKPDEATTNVDHEIFFSQDWSSLKRSQAEDRAHRRGTRNNVRITDLCVPNTIDEVIRARVLEKRMAALEITDIRQILAEVLNRE